MDPPPHMPNFNPTLIHTFIAFQLTGASIFLLILVSALLCRTRINRHPVWYNFCVSWVVFGVSFSLLTLFGEQFKLEPRKRVCFVQAGLVYAAPFLASWCSLGLVIQLLLSVLSVLSSSPTKKRYPKTITLVLIFPWIAWIVILCVVLMYASRHRETVQLSPNGTFCVLRHHIVPKVTSASATIVSISIIIAEVIIGMLLYRYRAVIEIFRQALGMAIRVLIFTLAGIVAIALVFVISRSRGVQFDVVLATRKSIFFDTYLNLLNFSSPVPLSTAIIFGSQMDLLRGLIFWKTAVGPRSESSGTSFASITTAFLRTISIRRQVSGSWGSVPLPAELESSRSTANLTLSGDSDGQDLGL